MLRDRSPRGIPCRSPPAGARRDHWRPCARRRSPCSAAPSAGVGPALSGHRDQRDPAPIGLFGQQDPTYDGVYRQSLSLIALDAAGARVPTPPFEWLQRQQCDNGRFPSYTDLTTRVRRRGQRRHRPCGHRPEAARQAQLGTRRDATGCSTSRPAPAAGSSTPASGPNANTTGLVVQAMIAMRIDPTTVEDATHRLGFLRSLQLDCTSVAADRGALDYQKQTPLRRQRLRDRSGDRRRSLARPCR